MLHGATPAAEPSFSSAVVHKFQLKVSTCKKQRLNFVIFRDHDADPYTSKVNPNEYYLIFHGYESKNLHLPLINIA